MEVVDALLANYAEMRDNLAFISGAFPEWLSSSALPIKPKLALVVVFQYDLSDLRHVRETRQAFQFTVLHMEPDGNTDFVVQMGTAPQVRAGHPAFLPIRQVVVVSSVEIEFQQPGEHKFIIAERDNITHWYHSFSLGIVKGEPGGPDWPLTEQP